MLTSWTDNILTGYDQCKRLRSAEECRQIASVGAARSVKGYLKGYDTCVDLFGFDRCRQMLSSEATPMIPVAAVFFIGGFLIGRILK